MGLYGSVERQRDSHVGIELDTARIYSTTYFQGYISNF